MKDLSRHIEFLLCENNSVAIPGIGTFTTEELPARYCTEENLYLPPVRSVKLDTNQKNDDGKLENCLVQLHRVTHIVAQKWIADYIENINHSLMDMGAMDMGTIGRLVLNNGTISFEVCEAGVNSPELYGLDSFHMSKLPPHAQKNRIYKDPTHFTIRLKRTTVHRVMTAAAMLIVILSVIVPNYEAMSFNGKLQTQLASTETLKTLFSTNPLPEKENTNLETTIEQATIQLPVETITEEKTDDKTVMPETLPNESISATTETEVQETTIRETVRDIAATTPEVKGYCVVMASAITHKGAELLIDKLNKEGFSNAVKYKDKGMLRVMLTGYPDEASARADLALVRNTDKLYSGSWIKIF